MTIARRLLILVAVPLLVLGGPRASFVQRQLDEHRGPQPVRRRDPDRKPRRARQHHPDLHRDEGERPQRPADRRRRGAGSRAARRSTRTRAEIDRLLRQFADCSRFGRSRSAVAERVPRFERRLDRRRRGGPVARGRGSPGRGSRAAQRADGGDQPAPERRTRRSGSATTRRWPPAPAMRPSRPSSESRRDLFLALGAALVVSAALGVLTFRRIVRPIQRPGEPGPDDRRRRLHAGGAVDGCRRRDRRARPLDRGPEAGRRVDGGAALGEEQRCAAHRRAPGRRLARRVRRAAPLRTGADAGRRRRRLLPLRERAGAPAAHRRLRARAASTAPARRSLWARGWSGSALATGSRSP